VLLKFAEHEFYLGKIEAGGTVREHLLKHWRDTGEKPKELGEFKCPDCARYLWGYFCNMSKRRGKDPISNQEMLAWAGMRGIRLLKLEIDALEIVRTYPFVAEWNDAGGAALALDQTIATVQDSQL